MKKPLTILALVCLPLLLQADEFVYDANVVRSEPVTTTRVLDRMPAECLIGKPVTGSMGMRLFLAWPGLPMLASSLARTSGC